MRILLSSLIFLVLASAPVRAERDEARVYAFGNSLVHHLSESDETTVPHWLALMSLSARKDFRLSGQWGFLRDFAKLPPEPNWSFGKVREAWNSGRFPFERSRVDTIWITPANFIQDGPADRPYPDNNSAGASPLSATLEVIDWVSGQTPEARIMIYEGWPDMGPFAARFPPRPRSLRKYHDFASGDYAAWFRDFATILQAERPSADITLLPVSTALSHWLSGTLSGLPPEELYVDSAPHGTANLYFLASLVAYAALFDAEPPDRFRPPENIHPAIRDAYPQLAAEALEIVRVKAIVTAQQPEQIQIPANPRVVEAQSRPAEVETVAQPTATTGAATAPPDIAVQPLQGLANPSLAMGLNGVADWSSQQPFVDVFKTARPWTGHLPGQWGGVEAQRLEDEGHLDAQGWPIRVPPYVTKLETFVLSDMPEGARDLAGRYVLRWEGDGDLRVGGRAQNAQYSYSDRQVVFDYSPGEGLVSVAFSRTEPENPIRNISIVREEHLALHEAGVLFNPDWIARIDDLRMVRFMDWMFTNGSTKAGWDDRARVDDYTWVRRGVPVEVMVRLANLIGADPWFNMPHMADDDYVTRFASVVRDSLRPGLKAHVEYSNELWNFIFPQAGWAREQAEARWGNAEGDRWMQFAGGRAAEVAAIWSDVYGSEATTRLSNVIAVHTGWPGLEEAQLEAPLWRDAVAGRRPPAAAFDAYAIAAYFGYELGETENADQLRGWIETSRVVAEATVAKLPEGDRAAELEKSRFAIARQLAAAAVAQGSLAELTDTLLPYHADVARRYQLDLAMYEGGSHVTGIGALVEDPEVAEFFTQLNYTAEMADLYSVLLAGWQKAGGHEFNAFVDVAIPSKWGSWGALRHLSDDNPRWDRLMQANTVAPHWDEPREEDAFQHGLWRLGTGTPGMLVGTDRSDILIAGDGDDRIVTGAGHDRVHGGDGLDVAVLPRLREAYDVRADSGRLVLTAETDEVWLTEVERVAFSDGQEMAVEDLR